MSVYICGTGAISIQDTFKRNSIESPIAYYEPHVRCIEPDFKKIIAPVALRRMNKIIRRAITSSIVCIEDSGIAQPEAIISGTGLGCIDDTEKFLAAMIQNEEQFLQPTFFIQTTHNSIASQIAIYLKNHAYNTTFSHRGISFESALMDASILFRLGHIRSALVGGFDEMPSAFFNMFKKVGFWRENLGNSLTIFEDQASGSFSGEGSVSFMLAEEKNEKTYAELQDISLLYALSGREELKEKVLQFLRSNGLTPHDIDVFMTGLSGDMETDYWYYHLADDLFPDTPLAAYKHLCGEYFTASAFGLWSAVTAMKNKCLPDFYMVNGKSPAPLKHVLIYNQYRNKNHSLLLLQ